MKNIRLGLVVSDFNEEITSIMEKAAEKAAKSLKLDVAKKIHVPGAFEIPFAANKLLKDKKIEAVVALGAVLQGETHHDVVIMNAVSSALVDLSVRYNKPIGFGIIGPRVTWIKAKARAEEYAKRAVEAALQMCRINSR